MFAVTCFGVAFGFFFYAMGAALVVGVVLTLIATLRVQESAIVTFQSSLAGIVTGILGAILFLLSLSLFVD